MCPRFKSLKILDLAPHLSLSITTKLSTPRLQRLPPSTTLRLRRLAQTLRWIIHKLTQTICRSRPPVSPSLSTIAMSPLLVKSTMATSTPTPILTISPIIGVKRASSIGLAKHPGLTCLTDIPLVMSHRSNTNRSHLATIHSHHGVANGAIPPRTPDPCRLKSFRFSDF